MTYSFTHESNGRRRRVVFEERLDATGKPQLVATHIDGAFTAEEMDEFRAQAYTEWLHPNVPPSEWFD